VWVFSDWGAVGGDGGEGNSSFIAAVVIATDAVVVGSGCGVRVDLIVAVNIINSDGVSEATVVVIGGETAGRGVKTSVHSTVFAIADGGGGGDDIVFRCRRGDGVGWGDGCNIRVRRGWRGDGSERIRSLQCRKPLLLGDR
jgi:hypothetical protein